MNDWRQPSISLALPVGVALLLSLAVVAMASAGYVDVRMSARGVATDRLNQGARQIVDLLTTSERQLRTAVATFAAVPDVLDALRAPDADASHAALTRAVLAVRRGAPAPARGNAQAAIELWNVSLARVTSIGPGLPAMNRAQAAEVAQTAARASGPVTTPFSLVNRSEVLNATVAPVLDHGTVAGYVVERQRLNDSSQTMAVLSGLLGSGARLLLGNAAGDVWTDFSKPVASPAAPLTGLMSYTRADGTAVFGRALAVPGTPWMVLAEVPQGPILAPVRTFVERSGTIAVVIIITGVAAGWRLGRRVTDPLAQMTAAAEQIAQGRTSERLRLDRRDELGRLAAAFDAMTAEVNRHQHELEATVDRYRLLYELNPLPMWLHSPETLQVLDVNAAAIAFYGHTRDAFLHLTLESLTAAPGLTPDARADLAGSSAFRHGTFRHWRKNGDVVDVDLTWQAFPLKSGRVVLTVARDRTAELDALRAVERSEAALRAANANLEHRVDLRTADLNEANHELEAFSYSVSHDLRAPLRAIVGFSRILLEDHAAALPAEARAHLEVIARNTTRMGQLIDDLLAFSRISRQPIARAAVDMTGLARAVADEAGRAESNRVIRFNIHPLPPAQGERAMVRQVLDNLVLNAVKFTRTREHPEIEIGARQHGGDVVYYVRDNGVGFDMQYADKLFGVFQRLHRSDEFEGTGVGLAIVQRIVARHNGRVWADGEVDHGATFFFTLPGAEEGHGA